MENFYEKKKDANDKQPPSWGLNSRLVKESDGKLIEQVWKADGMYGPTIQKIIYWLKQAATVAENDQQRNVIGKLIKYYQTGNLRDFDDYSIAWLKEQEGRIDFINGFIEKEKLLESATRYGKSPYGAHLKAVAEGKVKY